MSTVQLEPFMAMLVSYLSVGLSHLHRNVQEDALRMLDAVLAVAPTLVARAAPLLLPAFLDQISVRRSSGGTERTLSLDLQSTNTSTRWRIKVLGRLHAMLSAAADPASSCVNKPKEVHYSPKMSPYISINLMRPLDEICIIPGLFGKGANLLAQEQLFQDDEQMKKYIAVLMPLLFETWIEVGPSQKQTRETGNLTY